MKEWSSLYACWWFEIKYCTAKKAPMVDWWFCLLNGCHKFYLPNMIHMTKKYPELTVRSREGTGWVWRNSATAEPSRVVMARLLLLLADF